jgi:hypothetical protein
MTKTIRRISGHVLGAALLTAVVSATPVVRYRAVAVNMSNVGAPGLFPLDITIERWTTDEELARLRDALLEKGSDRLLEELQEIEPRAGYIRRADGGLGWDIRYARKMELPDGGYRVVFGTDRPMSFYERVNQPRSAEYEFLLGELRMRPDGKGEGKLVPMAKITYDKDDRLIEIENYASEPVRLTEVTEMREDAD